jgi:U3 small nucleolar RNA-associated protein 4
MTVECRGRSVPTQIWTLDTTIDGTLISGDSLGQVQFWRDGVWLGSLEQNNNQADVLAVMAVGKDKAFASGVDARVVCLQRNEDHQWVVAQAVRPHTHDVMAMALVDGQTTLVTAGVDNKLCSYRIAEWGRRRPVVTYPWPTRSPVSVGGRRVAMARNQQVDLYKLGDVQNDENFPQVQSSENQIGTIQVGQYVQHVCLGPNAAFLAVQTVYLRIFRIVESKKGAFQPQEIKSLDKPIQNVVTMRFLDNETLVVATASRKLLILKMPRNDSQELTILAEHTQQDELTALPVHSIASFGTEWVATLASEGTRHRAVSVYNIQSDEINLVWTLPDVGSKITALTFLPDGRLAVASEHFTFYLFDVATRSLATWSETAGLPMVMPSEVSTRRDFPVHIGVNPASPSVLFLVSVDRSLRGVYCVEYCVLLAFPSSGRLSPPLDQRLDLRPLGS